MDSKKEPLIMLSNCLYDYLKAMNMVVLPGGTALYLGLFTAFGLSWSVEVVIFSLLFTAFLGTLLILSSRSHLKSDLKYDGTMLVTQNEEGEILYTLELDDNPIDLRLKSHISFKVLSEA